MYMCAFSNHDAVGGNMHTNQFIGVQIEHGASPDSDNQTTVPKMRYYAPLDEGVDGRVRP